MIEKDIAEKVVGELVTWKQLNAMTVDALTVAKVHEQMEVGDITLFDLLVSMVSQLGALTQRVDELEAGGK